MNDFKVFFGSLESNEKKMETRIVEIGDFLNQVLSLGEDIKVPSKSSITEMQQNMSLLAQKIIAVKNQLTSVSKDLSLKVSTLEASVSGLHQQLTCGVTPSIKAAAISTSLLSQSSRPISSLGLDFNSSSLISKPLSKGTEYNSDNLL